MKRKKIKAEKKVNGKKLVEKAGLAIKHEFYLDTTWILSLVFEKKAKNFLKQIEGVSNLKGYTFEQSIKRIKYHHQGGSVPQLEKHLDLGLIEEMRNWKNTRNTMLKDMVNVHVSQNRMQRLAEEGITLYKKWNRSLKNVKSEIKKSDHHAWQKETSQPDEN